MTADQRPRIVVADDHPRVRDVVAALLGQAFDVVAPVGDGAAAVEATLRLQPDVVVLDVAMPGLDGIQAAARLVAAGSPARIVFLSSYTGDDVVLAALSRGGSAFVTKLQMARDLLPAVAYVLAGHSFVPSAGVLPRWPRADQRHHDLQLYATEALLIDQVMAFFDSAFEAGHSLVAIASRSRLQAIDAQFRARRVDIDALAAAGRYSSFDASLALEAVLRDGVPDRSLYESAIEPVVARSLAASTGSPPHVSFFGEIAPLLLARGDFDAMIRLEQIADEYASARPVSFLCGYSTEDLARSTSDVAKRVCREHATIVPG